MPLSTVDYTGLAPLSGPLGSAAGQPLNLQVNGGTTAVTIDTSGNLFVNYDAGSFSYHTGKLAVYTGLDAAQTSHELYLISGKNAANQNSDSPRLNLVGRYQTAGVGIQAVNSSAYGWKDLVIYTHAANDYTTYSESLRLTAQGKLGIGTNVPGSLLTVNNTAFANASAIYVGTNSQVTGSSAYGGVITIRDSYASGSNTSFAGINFQASPGNDYSIGKLVVNSSAYLSIYQSDTPTELLRIDNTGSITFKVVNSGITFNNSSALTNSTLNDYETGTCNLYISDGTTNSQNFSCSYTKIGRLVMVTAQMYAINTTSMSASANLILKGLPFTIAGSNLEGTLNIPKQTLSPIMIEGSTATNQGLLYYPGTGALNWLTLTLTSLNISAGAGNLSIYGTLSYHANF
jgi:hypothetical protein